MIRAVYRKSSRGISVLYRRVCIMKRLVYRFFFFFIQTKKHRSLFAGVAARQEPAADRRRHDIATLVVDSAAATALPVWQYELDMSSDFARSGT